MPVMDGYTATRQLRQREAELQLPRLPVIALTAAAFENDREHCAAAGMDDFLSKPVVVEQLLATIERWQQRHASAQTSGTGSTDSAAPR